MTTPTRQTGKHPRRQRPPMRKVAVSLPNGLTLANLFFGIFAIVAASRGEFATAGLYVVIGGIADALDGRVARATNTGSDFGSELDSLVDIISFGLAPAMIMYFAVLNREGWDWIFSFLYVAAAALRLARFNIEQAGRAKTYFHGLPSPAAGLTLATYYWFSQTPLYSEANIANLPWHIMLRFVMGGLSILMISDVSYPAFPAVGYRTLREILGSIAVAVTILGVFIIPRQFFFPACLGYVLYGLIKTAVLGLIGRRTMEHASMFVETSRQHASVDEARRHPTEPIVAVTSPPRLNVSADAPMPPAPPRRRRRRRPPRGDRPDRSDNPESPPPTPSGE